MVKKCAKWRKKRVKVKASEHFRVNGIQKKEDIQTCIPSIRSYRVKMTIEWPNTL